MITHWALALGKGIREPRKVKKKSFDLGGNRTHDDLRIKPTVTLPICRLSYEVGQRKLGGGG